MDTDACKRLHNTRELLAGIIALDIPAQPTQAQSASTRTADNQHDPARSTTPHRAHTAATPSSPRVEDRVKTRGDHARTHAPRLPTRHRRLHLGMAKRQRPLPPSPITHGKYQKTPETLRH